MNSEWIKGEGTKLSKGGRSMIIDLLCRGGHFSREQLLGMAAALARFRIDIAELPEEIIVADKFASRPALLAGSDMAFYKRTDEAGLKFMLEGSIKLGSVGHYRKIENPLARDYFEGWGIVCFRGKKNDFVIGGTSGMSSYVYCGTSRLQLNDYNMNKNFGHRLIKINNITEFSRRISEKIGANEVNIADINYRDGKIMLIHDAITKKLNQDLARFSRNGVLDTKFDDVFMKKYMDFVLDKFELTSVFCKPKKYSAEAERRIHFSMPRSVSDVCVVSDPSLADFIEVIV